MTSTISCNGQRFILFICDCMKIQKHSEWINLKSNELIELKERKDLFETIFQLCPDCLKLKSKENLLCAK